MKNLIKTIAVTILLAVTFTSCEKSDVRPETVEPVAPEKPKVEYIHIDLYTNEETAGVHYTLLINKGLPSEKVITKIEDGECCVRGRDYVKVSFTAPYRLETIEVIQESPVRDINWGDRKSVV